MDAFDSHNNTSSLSKSEQNNMRAAWALCCLSTLMFILLTKKCGRVQSNCCHQNLIIKCYAFNTNIHKHISRQEINYTNLFLVRLFDFSESLVPFLGLVFLLNQIFIGTVHNPVLSNKCSLRHVPSTQNLHKSYSKSYAS